MDKETYEKQKAFAGEKKPSMLRRMVGHDYTERQMYMITMVTEGRQPLLGTLVGNADAPDGVADAPKVELSPLGKLVEREWWACQKHHPEIEVIALQLMPDHLHGILFVQSKMEKPLGLALRGFKQSCNKHYKTLVLGQMPSPVPSSVPSVVPSPASSVALSPASSVALSPASSVAPSVVPSPAPSALPSSVSSVALSTQQTPPTEAPLSPKKDRRGEDRTHGLLFAPGYNDRLLLRSGQLDRWKTYLHENPRRLAIRRAHPNLFRVRFGLTIAGQTYAVIGNQFLLQHPVKVQVQLSRSLTEADIQAQVAYFLSLAQQGAVLVSPAISKGEQAVMRAALDARLPLIFLTPWGFNSFSKPGHQYFQACSEGRFLILAPWEHQNERIPLTRSMCLTLNEMVKRICEV